MESRKGLTPHVSRTPLTSLQVMTLWQTSHPPNPLWCWWSLPFPVASFPISSHPLYLFLLHQSLVGPLAPQDSSETNNMYGKNKSPPTAFSSGASLLAFVFFFFFLHCMVIFSLVMDGWACFFFNALAVQWGFYGCLDVSLEDNPLWGL